MEPEIKAVLFDIDGTILNAGSAGRKAFMQAAGEVFGSTGTMQKVDFQGRTDRYILEESFKNSPLRPEELNSKIELMKKAYTEALGTTIYQYEAILLPGIKEALNELYKNQNIILGLLTGNFVESAFIKLARFGLDKFFSLGAYGEDSTNRSELPPVAQRRILENKGIHLDFSRMIIIGDTIHDIECAKTSGAVSVAVGTGLTSKETLMGKNPDYYFDDLSDTENFLGVISAI
ncbi:MAG: HAD hydrolase-like protein [Leptospirales bacterium]|nr:HAD hydrolase-like protein [Leptospirales bacterium]